jgi:hypothetical protein
MYTEMLIRKPESECKEYGNMWEDSNPLVLKCMSVYVCGVSKKFSEWYQKTN